MGLEWLLFQPGRVCFRLEETIGEEERCHKVLWSEHQKVKWQVLCVSENDFGTVILNWLSKKLGVRCKGCKEFHNCWSLAVQRAN